MSAASRTPVQIIGAGPAGMAAALLLSRAGRHVDVFDRPSRDSGFNDVGWRLLDSWSTGRSGLEILQILGISGDCHHTPIHSLTVIGPDRERIKMSSAAPIALLVKGEGQGGLLDTLRDHAEIAGARVIQSGTPVQVNSRNSVIATGPRSSDGLVCGARFTTTADDGVYVFFDDRLSPKGMSTLLIHDRTATLTARIYDRLDDSQECFARLFSVSRDHLRVDVIGEPHYFLGPISYTLPSVWPGGKRHLIGSCSGAQDALFGYGLALALESASLATDSILCGYDYQQGFSRLILPRLRAAIANRFVFGQLGNHGYSHLIRSSVPGNLLGRMRELYAPSARKDQLFSVAQHQLHPFCLDRSCHRQNCDCVWCEHSESAINEMVESCGGNRTTSLTSGSLLD